MRRLEFLAALALVAAPRAAYAAARSDGDKIDPALGQSTQALRVLLGPGEVEPIDEQSFIFNNRRYRGSFSDSSQGTVNTVALEHYLYSVVPREMPRLWPAAAIQTQAIVARTYVLARSNPRAAYDLVPSEANQVYTGVDAEHAETSAAVDATAGMVLRYGNGFANVMYSSCCGGHTEASSQAWGGVPIPYLCGVVCRFCGESPWYRWSESISLEQLQNALAPQLVPAGMLDDVRLDAPDASGRAPYWIFTGGETSLRVRAADVRRALGTRTLPSLLVKRLQVQDGPPQGQRSLVIDGCGLGHGVGLCQWGARGMAANHADVRQILAQYYPGTSLGHV